MCTAFLQTAYLSVTHCLEQEQQDGFKMFVPHLQGVLANQFQQFTKCSFPLLYTLVVIGQLLQQLSYQL